MIIHLFGSDSYLRGKKLKSLIEAYREKYPVLDLFSVDLDEAPEDWLKAKDFLNQPSMFVETKVLVVKESSMVKEKDWLKALKREVETKKTFVLISDATPSNKSFGFLNEPPVKAQEFPILKNIALSRFIEDEARIRNLEFLPSAARYFIDFINNQSEKSWVVIKELDRLQFAKVSKPINLENLKKLIEVARGSLSYETAARFLSEPQINRRLPLLESFILTGEAPAKIFNLLAYDARGENALKFADYDVAIKSGRLDYEEALLDFALSVSKP